MTYNFLKDSWNLFSNNIIFISLLIIPILAPVDALLTYFEYAHVFESNSITESGISLFVTLLTYPIYAIAIVLYISSVISGHACSYKELMRLGVTNWKYYFLLSAVVSILVIGGFFVFILPGIIFAVRYSFSEIFLLVENENPMGALSRSWRETKNHFWTLLKGYILITLAIYIPNYFIAQAIGFDSLLAYIFNYVLGLVCAILNVLYVIFAFRVYESTKNTLQSELV